MIKKIRNKIKLTKKKAVVILSTGVLMLNGAIIKASSVPNPKNFKGLNPDQTKEGAVAVINQYGPVLSAIGVVIAIAAFGGGVYMASHSSAKDQKIDDQKSKLGWKVVGCFCLAGAAAIATIAINIMNQIGG